MNDPNNIRFISTNYVSLQGLRVVPLGICSFLLCLWANAQRGGDRNFILPIAIIVGTFISILVIGQYYSHVFGRVQRTPESRRFEWLISNIGSILAFVALWVDLTFRLPVSCVGIIFSLWFFTEYLRITWFVKGRFLLYYPLGALLGLILSILPIFGIQKWWLLIGFENQLFGFLFIMSIFIIIVGVWGHIFLIRTLSPKPEVNNDHAI